MFLIIGLGNPGNKYTETRHNVGFLFLDYLKESLGVKSDWQAGYKGVFIETTIYEEKIILLKPLTYMNLSGQSAQACAHFYKISPDKIILITDDIDMAFGKIRYRATGNAGGHNGIASVIEQLGTRDIQRIKIGIDRHPQMEPADWVLSKFSKEEKEKINDIFPEVEEKLRGLIETKD